MKSNIPVVNLKKQYESVSDEVDSAIRRVFDSGWFILGKELESFEVEFASFIGTEYAVGVGNGTDAIQLILMGLGIGPGDEVITVPNTAFFTVSAIEAVGAIPVFSDIDENTFTINTSKISNLITDKTKAILPVHLFGRAAEMDELLKISEQHKIHLIEDSCQAHGSVYSNRQKTGSIGIAGAFSFYPSKNLGAYGDGGMITTSDEELAKRLKMLRHGGQSSRYQHDYKGINSRLDEIQAAVLRVKLKYLDSWNQRRRDIAAIYEKLINNEKVVKPLIDPDGQVFHLYVVKVQDRDAFQSHLLSNGIQTAIHYPVPIHLQKAFEDDTDRSPQKLCRGLCPTAEKVMKHIVSLPMFPDMTDKEAEEVAAAVNTY